MSQLRIALDMDSTLADSQALVRTILDDQEEWTTWEEPAEKHGLDAFLGAFGEVWTHHWWEVEPMEPMLATTTRELADDYHVDVVTAQPEDESVVKGKESWLIHWDIEFVDLVTVPTTETKAALDYDIYIDDKPALPRQVEMHDQDAFVYLRDRPYNQDAPGDYKRVSQVADVLGAAPEAA